MLQRKKLFQLADLLHEVGTSGDRVSQIATLLDSIAEEESYSLVQEVYEAINSCF